MNATEAAGRAAIAVAKEMNAGAVRLRVMLDEFTRTQMEIAEDMARLHRQDMRRHLILTVSAAFVVAFAVAFLVVQISS